MTHNRLAITAVPVLGLLLSGAALAQQDQERERATRQEQSRQQESQQAGAPLHVAPAVVRQLQQELHNAGYDAGPVDGIWGRRTQQALREYQEAQGLAPTGQVNRRTLARLGIQTREQDRTEFSAMEPEGAAQGSGTAAESGARQQGPAGDWPGPDMGKTAPGRGR